MPHHIKFIDAYADKAIEKLNGLGISDVVFSMEIKSDVYAINIDAPTTSENLSNQNGITKFREILKDRPDAKFILYSFQSKAVLIAQKPENEIIRLLPFIQLPFEKENVKAAIKEMEAKDYPFFNVQAEYFLSSWALNGKEMKIDLSKKILIIDDDYKYWKATYSAIFKGRTIESLFDESKAESRKRVNELLNGDDFNKEEKEKLEKATLIISDLYLTEEHREVFNSTKSNRKSISGYKIYRKIREQHKITPVMMFTTSNKTWNYRLFEDAGIHEWCVKENYSTADTETKQAYFEDFKENLNHIFGEKGKAIINIGREIEDFLKKEYEPNNHWWIRKKNLSKGQFLEIKEVLLDCYFLLRRAINRDKEYESIMSVNTFGTTLCCSIIIRLAVIPETIYQAYGNAFDIKDTIGQYLFFLRNAASHVGTSRHFNIDDVIIAFRYLLDYLNADRIKGGEFERIVDEGPKLEINKNGKIKNVTDIKKQAEELLLFDHIAFFNDEASRIDDNVRTLLKNRIDAFAKSYYFGELRLIQQEKYYGYYYTSFVETNDAFPRRVEVVERIRNGKKRIVILFNPKSEIK